MARAKIGANAFQRWAGERRFADDDHAMHALLGEMFGRKALQPFRVMSPNGRGLHVLYAYTATSAEDLREAARSCADPLQDKIMLPGKLDVKTMPGRWREGKKWGFDIRIRPTRRLTRPVGDWSKRKELELDAYLMQALDQDKETLEREQVYAEWLRERLERNDACQLETVVMRSCQRTRARRKRNARYSEAPDVIMRGALTVSNGDAFAELLSTGVGRHRAYGYGMLLLRPPERVAGR